MTYEIGFVDDAGSEGVAHWQLLLKIKTLAEANGWTTMRYLNPTPFSDPAVVRELIMKGVGLSGAEEIYIGFRTYQNVASDYYNISTAAFIGYVPGSTFTAQPGYYETGIPAHNQRIDYWIQCNAQRINLALKVTGPVYVSGGCGKMFPLSTPGQYPLPLYCAGMFVGMAAVRYSDTNMSMGWRGSRGNMAIRWIDGSYRSPEAFPWNNPSIGGTESQLRDAAGDYPVLRVTLCQSGVGVYGFLDGIGYVSNFNNTVESVVQVGGTPVVDNPAWTPQQRVDAITTAGGESWVCIQDAARTSFNDYFAMRMA